MICLDEIQRKPEFFPVIRSLIDQNKTPGQFLILGSASPSLLRQSSESLAGRIEYLELSPFLITEISNSFLEYWERGGYPDSLLAPNRDLSKRWRENFISTFLEKDIPNFGLSISSENLRRFWKMCAHYHGQCVNFSKIGQSLSLSHTAIRHYTDIMSSTFVIRLLQPFQKNIKKRLIKSPKLYIRDTGILHQLLTLDSFEDLSGHPVYGASFEGLIIENILMSFPDWEGSFYRTQAGAEIDLILTKGNRTIAIECKASKAPIIQKGFYLTCDDLDIKERFVIGLVDSSYKIGHGITVCNLSEFLEYLAGNNF